MTTKTRTRAHTHSIALLVLLALLAPFWSSSPATAAPAEPSPTATTITEGSVVWGIKQSWREYIGRERTSATGGATITPEGLFDFPVKSGTFDAATNSLALRLSGEVHFTSYCEAGACLLDSLFEDLSVEISANEQIVRGTYSGVPRDNPGGPREYYTDVVLATLDLNGATADQNEGRTRWSSLPAVAGPGMTLYAEGTPIDPVSISYRGPGGIPDLGETWDPQGAPAFTAGDEWVADDTSKNSRAVYASRNADIAHVVEIDGIGTSPVVIVTALDSVTLEPVTAMSYPVSNDLDFQAAFDPVSDSTYVVSRAASDPLRVEVHRLSYDPTSRTYSSEVVGAFDAVAPNLGKVVSSVTWNHITSELALVVIETTADQTVSYSLRRYARSAQGTWTASFSDLAVPASLRADASEPFGNTNFLYFRTYLAAARDGSYILAGGGRYRDPSDQQRVLPALWISPTGEDLWTVEGIEGTVPPVTRDLPPEGYMKATATGSGPVLLHAAGFLGTYQYVDIVDGRAIAVSEPLKTLEPLATSAGAAAFDVDRGIDYLFAASTKQITVVIDKKVVSELKIDGAFSGFVSYPMAVTRDGSLIAQVKDAASGNAALRRYFFEGITPRVTSSPQGADVVLAPEEQSRSVEFTADAVGEGDPEIQWQRRGPGASTFSDIQDATSTTLTVDATREASGSQYRAVFSNDAGRVVTDAAVLNVTSAPVIDTQPRDVTIYDGEAASFSVLASGNPAPTVTWEQKTAAGWVPREAAEGITVNGASLTFEAATRELNATVFRAVVTNAVGTTYSDDVTLTVLDRPTVPEGGATYTDVAFEWTGSPEWQQRPPNGGRANYFSAGVSDGSEKTYAATSGGVTVVQRYASGDEKKASWATRGAHVTAGGEAAQVIRMSDGTAKLKSDGSATVTWPGAFSVNFYDGLVPFTMSNLVLNVAADGTGTLTADLSGYAGDMADPNKPKEPTEPVADVVVATFAGVIVDPERGFTIDPAFEGVTVEVGPDATPQNRAGARWGSWPQSFVDFHLTTGLAGYFYTTGGSLDVHKTPAPIMIGFDDARLVDESSPGSGGEPVPGSGGEPAPSGAHADQGKKRDALSTTGAEIGGVILLALVLLGGGLIVRSSRRKHPTPSA